MLTQKSVFNRVLMRFFVMLTTLVWINSAAAESELFFSAQAAAEKHGVFKFDSLDKIKARTKLLEKVDMRLVDLEIQQNNQGGFDYLGVWMPGTGKYAIELSNNWTEFTQSWDNLSAAGYRLLDVERVLQSGQLKYYAVYGEGNGAYAMYAAYWDDFTRHWNDASGSGLRLVDVDVYNYNGQNHYLGVYQPGNDAYVFYSTSSYSDFTNKYNQYLAANMELVDVDLTYNSNNSHQYVGTWRSGNGQGRLKLHKSWAAFKKDWVQQVSEGYSLLDFDISKGNGANSFQYYIASYGPAPSQPTDNPDLTDMASFLENRFANEVNGMSYAISQNGQMAVAGATGFAQRTPDPEIAMTSEARSTIASVTKMVTAPLVYNLLAQNGLTLDSPIHPWLPASWNRGPGFGLANSANITFRHLLTHTSGIGQNTQDGWGTSWDQLSRVVSDGVTNPGARVLYENINYALMRLLIPALWSAQDGPSDPLTRENSVQRYIDFMSQLIANNQGIHSIACRAQPAFTESRMYIFRDFGVSGWSFIPNPADDCGGHAMLNLSAQDMTSYWDAVRFNDDIVSDADRATMRNRAGMWNSVYIDGTDRARGHSGGWYWGDGAGIRETTTCLLEFPHNINASIILNSDSIFAACSSLRDAYRDAL